MKTMLVPVDFSPATRTLLDAACAFARDLQARLVLIHVAPEIEADRKNVRIPQHERDAVAKILRARHRELQQLTKALTEAGCIVDALLVQGHGIDDKIIAEAGRLEADLIVMGTGGHGRLHDILLGSTCQKVLRKSPIPTLIIPVGRHEHAYQPADERSRESADESTTKPDSQSNFAPG